MALCPAVLSAGSKHVPARLGQARYVALAYDLGDRFLLDSESIADPDITPQDREALAEVRDQIEKWNRYVIASRANQAELVVAIRRGRRGAAVFGAPIGGSGRVPGTTRARAELSSPDDMLSVYEASVGMTATLLWRQQRPGGLSGSPPSLLTSFRSAVESSSKQP
jgi:hypothetical protein